MAGNPRVSTELLIPKKFNNNVREMLITSTSPDDRSRVRIAADETPKKWNKIAAGAGGRNLINSPDHRSQVWIEPEPKKKAMMKVSVLYYLSRNGHLEHPHLIEVPLASSSQGLYLRDVMNSLNLHRGKGMANLYSWSSKRNYKNGYVWHDVSEDDLIHPTSGQDYVLKGTELLQTSSDFRSYDTNSTQTPATETNNSGEDFNSTAEATVRRRNQSWSSFGNPQEYVVYKCESSREIAANFAADAATQTEERGRMKSFGGSERGEKESVGLGLSVELSREEMVSPPQLNSSEDGGSDGIREVERSGEIRDRSAAAATAEDRYPSGRMKASKVLMQLISCGAVSVNGGRSQQEWTFDERK